MNDSPFVSLMLESPAGVAAVRLLGRAPPLREEVVRARQILDAAPRGEVCVAVARYFEELTEMNADGELYNAEWSHRANPVILAFIIEGTTGIEPDGDITPWCAAFVNWCLQRCGRRGTRSALSGSFRCVGQAAAPPAEGDLAVFKNEGHDAPCTGKGHVGFFLDETPTHLRVLGGNQGNRVKVTTYSKAMYLGSRSVATIP